MVGASADSVPPVCAGARLTFVGVPFATTEPLKTLPSHSIVRVRSIDMVQSPRGKDVFVHISAVEKAGFSGLPEGAKISYEVISDRGKEAAANLRL